MLLVPEICRDLDLATPVKSSCELWWEVFFKEFVILNFCPWTTVPMSLFLTATALVLFCDDDAVVPTTVVAVEWLLEIFEFPAIIILEIFEFPAIILEEVLSVELLVIDV